MMNTEDECKGRSTIKELGKEREKEAEKEKKERGELLCQLYECIVNINKDSYANISIDKGKKKIKEEDRIQETRNYESKDSFENQRKKGNQEKCEAIIYKNERNREKIEEPNKKQTFKDKNICGEIESYYFVCELNRKIEDSKRINEMKMLKSERNDNTQKIYEKIQKVLACYEDIKNELYILTKNKQFIYKTFHSIFLHYYYINSQVKMMKLKKKKIEKHVHFYTNIQKFETALNNMEKDAYSYFVNMYNDSINNKNIKDTDSVEQEEEEEEDEEEEELDWENDNDISKYYINNIKETVEEVSEFQLSEEMEVLNNIESDKKTEENNIHAIEDVYLNKNSQLESATYINDISEEEELKKKVLHSLMKTKKKKKKSDKKKSNRKNEIYYMLDYSEEAIKYFNNNYRNTTNCKTKINKYQSIIRRILNYIKKIFRDVLISSDLDIQDAKQNIDYLKYDKHNKNNQELKRETNDNERDKQEHDKYTVVEANKEESQKKKSDRNDKIKWDSLLLIKDESEINELYNNFNIIYFNKYINEFEYYKKYKIKCTCMKDTFNFIYNKSLENENSIYMEDYHFLENFYANTRLKILNNNILTSFHSFNKKDPCKYIKNVCLMAIYVSQLETDLFFYIFNNHTNSSLTVILNTIGGTLYETISENIYNLNNIQVIRRIIQIICVDIIETYQSKIYNILCDYLKNVCNTLKERLLYIIEIYISYYTKNGMREIPYICFCPLKKKFVNVIKDYFSEDNLNHINENDEESIESKSESYIDSDENENAGNEHEYNTNMLNKENVYTDFNFINLQFNQYTTFCLRGIDTSVIGTIIILKTIHCIFEEDVFMDLLEECLENSFNSLNQMYKQYIKEHQDLFNGCLFLLKNLSILLRLTGKVTKQQDSVFFYLSDQMIRNLLNYNNSDKEEENQKQLSVNNVQNETEQPTSIFSFFHKVYNFSLKGNIQKQIVSLFNESFYNFILNTISNVCAPLIKISVKQYGDKFRMKEKKIKYLTNKILNEKIDQMKKEGEQINNCQFTFLKEFNMENLENCIKEFLNEENMEKVNNDETTEEDVNEIKTNLQDFRNKIYFLFPKIYYYIKLFICSNTDKCKGDNIYNTLFNFIIGMLIYKIVHLLIEVYIIIKVKFISQITLIDQSYVNDIILFF